MPALDPSIATLRADGHKVRYKIAVFAPQATVMEATLDSTPSFPASNLTITVTDGSDTAVKAGFRVDVFTSGGSFKGRTRVRYAGTISSSNLPVRETSKATISFAATDVIKVYREIRLADKLVGATEDFNPDGLSFSDQGANPPPVTCSGSPWAGEVDSGGSFATVLTKGDASYTVDPDSASGGTHLYTLPTGIAFQAGSVSTDANPVLEVDPGTYLVEHQFTDSDNSKATTQYIPMICDDGTNTFDCVLESLSAEEEAGWNMTVRLLETAGLDVFPDGALVILWLDEEIGGTAQSFGNVVSGRSHIKCVGYARRDVDRRDGREQSLTFEIISPLARWGELLGLSKVMVEDATPDDWSELKTLGTGRAIIQIAQFYSNLIECGFDLILEDSYVDYTYPAFYLQKQSPLGQLRELADATDGRVVGDRVGRFEVQSRLEYLALADRSGQTTTLTIAEDDWREIEITRDHGLGYELYEAEGFSDGSSPSPLFAKYPGDAPGEGNQTGKGERFIFDDVTDAYNRVGRRGAKADRVYQDSSGVKSRAPQLRLTLVGAYDVFDFYAEWVELDGITNWRGIDLTAFRYIVRSINISYEGGTATTELLLDAETNAAAGVDNTPPQPEANGIGGLTEWGDLFAYPPLVLTPEPILTTGVGNIVMAMSNAALHRANFQLVTLAWDTVDLSGTIGGTVKLFIVDARSYRASSSTINGWVISTTGIYYVTDLFGASPSPALQYTFTNTSANAGKSGDFAYLGAQAGLFGVIISNYNDSAPTGTYATYTTDGGSTWTEVQISANYVNANNRALGCMISNTTANVAYARVPNTTTVPPASALNCPLYRTIDGGANWADYSGTVDAFSDDDACGDVVFPVHGNGSELIAYCGAIDIGDSAYSGTTQGRYLLRLDGTSISEIAPSVSGATYGPSSNRARWGISVPTNNQNKVLLCGENYDGTLFGVFVTEDAGATWTTIVTPDANNDYKRGHLTNDGFAYLWGTNGAIALWDGVDVRDKIGNLSTAAECVGIAGG